MATKYHIPIDANPACFPQIGELVVRWGWIENQTTVLIRELLRIKKPVGDMAIGNMGIAPKTRVLHSLAKHAFATNRLGGDLVALAESIHEFEKFRNDVVHGLWVHSPKGTDQLALLMRKNLQQKVDPHPDKDALKRLPEKLAKLKALQADAQRLTRELKALRGKFE